MRLQLLPCRTVAQLEDAAIAHDFRGGRKAMTSNRFCLRRALLST